MAIVDDLLENPGLYLGLDAEPTTPVHPGAARILVAPLPGRAGVTLDYEVLEPRPSGPAPRPSSSTPCSRGPMTAAP